MSERDDAEGAGKAPGTDPKGTAGKPAGTGSSSANVKAEGAKAKADAKSAGAEAKAGARDVAGEARRAVSDVASSATEAAQGLASKAGEQLHDVAEERKAAGAERAQRIAHAVERAAGELDEELPAVGDYVRRAAKELEHVAETVRDREPAELLDVAQDLARRQPVLFAGATALLGFAAVRFLTASAPADRGGYRSGGTVGTGTGAARSGRATTDGGAELERALSAGGSGSHASGDPGGVAPEAPGLGLDDPKPAGDTSGRGSS